MAGSTRIVDWFLEPAGYQQVTSLDTVKSLTVPARANVALIQAEDKNVRWRDDTGN